MRRDLVALAALAALAVLLSSPAAAERLAIRAYATADGLAHGLPHSTVRDLLETKGGELWIATDGGLVRFNPNGIPAPGIVYANDVRCGAVVSAPGTGTTVRLRMPIRESAVAAPQIPKGR
jgi:ligand-binding sensor domain-containing protein